MVGENVQEKIEILSIPVCNVNMKEAVSYLLSRMQGQEPTVVATANAEMIMQAQHDAELATILQTADLVIPDGAGVLWAGEQIGKHFKERVAGCDLCKELLLAATDKQFPVYFLGGAEGIAVQAIENWVTEHGSLQVAGVHSGFFDEQEEKQIVEEIERTKPKLLLVALGVPKQEKWIQRYASRFEGCICIGVGGTLDVLAGKVVRAPKWMQRNRLEWLYRLYRQPSRWMRMLALPAFVFKVRSSKSESMR